MNTYTKVYLTFLLFYSLVVEAAIYIGSHHMELDPFLQINGLIILFGGGMLLFIFGIAGLCEYFWD